MIRNVCTCFFLLLTVGNSIAQESSNAYLLEWESSVSEPFQLSGLQYLTGFNPRGYNNQPFINGSDLYLSSSWQESDLTNTNIIALNIDQKTIRQVSDTEDAEFSPKMAGNSLFFVRLDGETNYQELWEYDGSELQKVLPETNVAYFTPITSDRLAVVLIENNQLNLYDINLSTNQKSKITGNVGRSLAHGMNGVLYFVDKYNADTWYIKTYDLLTGQIRIICKTIPGAEDFYLVGDKYLWMAKDQRIYRSTIQASIGSSWDIIFNLEDYPLNNIGRLCVIGGNKLVFINQ